MYNHEQIKEREREYSSHYRCKQRCRARGSFGVCRYKANIVIAARNEAALNRVKAECEELGAQVLVVTADTGDAKAMISLANAAIDWQDRIDVWINNAGVLAAGDFDVTPMAVHEQVIKTNLLGYMNGAHAVMPFF